MKKLLISVFALLCFSLTLFAHAENCTINFFKVEKLVDTKTVAAGSAVTMADEYAVLKTFLDTNFNSKNIPTFIVNGNHELFNKSYGTSGYDIDALYDIYDHQQEVLSQNEEISISRGDNCLFYSALFGDTKLIFLSVPTPAGSSVTYRVTDEQLAWLDEQLYDGEKSNKTNFVFTHVGLNGYIPYELTGMISNTEDVIKVLNKHPNTVMASGHTHSFLDSDELFTKVGDMTSTFSFYNDGCSVWLQNPDGTYFKDYSMGQYIEVYNDKILVKARQFTSPAKFISKGLYIITKPDSASAVGDASIDGEVANGKTLTAKYNGGKAPDGSKFSWIVNGNEVCTEESYRIAAGSGFGGNHVILRITLPDGAYSSCVSESVFDGFKVTYDANGGTGIVPPEEIVVSGCLCEVSKYKYCPQKDGEFFVGWTNDKDSKTPIASLKIEEDTTLYAIYSTRPVFEFYNMSGWSPNGVVASYSIDDGIMSCKAISTNGDLFFTLSETKIDADKNKILRLKMKLGAGTGTDCMFFATSESGFAQSKTRIPFYDTDIVSTADGMNIYEIYIPNVTSAKDYWHGTVTSLRYDVVGSSNGTATTDYIMFTDKKGIYSANLTVGAPQAGAAVSNDVQFTDADKYIVSDFVWNTDDTVFGRGKSYSCTVTLCPKDGYEFTTAEDILSNFTVNGEKLTSSAVDENGNAVLCYTFAPTGLGEFTFGDVSQDAKTLSLSFDGGFENSLVFAALFTPDGTQMLDCRMLSDVSSSDGAFTVKAQGKYENCVVQVFVLSDIDGLSPKKQLVQGVIKLT